LGWIEHKGVRSCGVGGERRCSDSAWISGKPASSASQFTHGHVASYERLPALPGSRMPPGSSPRGRLPAMALKRRPAPAENGEAANMQNHLTKRHVAMAGFSLLLLAVL
jgi:hypothetical protein